MALRCRHPYILVVGKSKGKGKGKGKGKAKRKEFAPPLWLVDKDHRALSGALNNGAKAGSIFFVAPTTNVYVEQGELEDPIRANPCSPPTTDIVSEWNYLVEQAVLDTGYGALT